MAVDKTYTIEDVWIVLTYKDGSEENFYLEAPNGDNAFEFGFTKIPKLEDYRDANMKWQRGCYYYQLFVRYQYESHTMDLRKLLVADNIALKFPPAFGQKENYNQADVLLANESVVKNYLAGLALGSSDGEVVPSGDLNLEFEGIDAFTEAQIFDNFKWKQDGDPEDTDPPRILEDVTSDVFVVGGGGTGGYPFGRGGFSLDFGGGGGAGGCLLRKEVILEEGEIDFYVGKGGENKQVNSFIFGSAGLSIRGADNAAKTYVDWIRVTLSDGTVHYTDFSEYTTGVIPSDWSKVIGGDHWTVESLGGATGGKVLQFTGASTEQHMIIWDQISNEADVIVEARVFTDTKDEDSRIRILSRASTGNFTAYLCELTGTPSYSHRVARVLSESFTNLDDDGNEFSWSASTWYTLKMDLSGASPVTVEGKFWETTEPGSPMVEDTHVLESSPVPGGGQKGENSWINDFIAYGGGRGEEITNEQAKDGGSGGGASKFPGTVTGAGGSGVNGQGVNGKPSSSAQTVSGSGGGAESVYDDVTFDFSTPEEGSDDGQDFTDLFGPYFAANYGADGAFCGGGLGAYTRSEADDETLETLTPSAGAGQGFIGDFGGIQRFATSAQQGTGSGGGAGVNSDSGSLDEPPGNGGSGFAMFRVLIEDADKVIGNFADIFDFDGYRHYVLPSDEVPVSPPPPVLYEGSIEVTSAAQSSDPGTAPSAEVIVRNSPSQQSDPCGIGGTEFNIEYKLTDYCTVLPVASPSNIALQVAQFISSTIPGLTATTSTSFDGSPSVIVSSTTAGTADEGERVIFGVPSVLEQDGPVFNRYEIFLDGGEEPTTIDTPVDIKLGKLTFATTANVVADETAASIATKIFNACDGVETADVSVTQDGNTVYLRSKYRLSISLDIGNTGFSYDITQMTEVP